MDSSDFDRFWNAYPRRKGDLAKTPARTLFDKQVKSGIPPEVIINGAVQYAKTEPNKVGTEFIMQAQRWLRNKRWLDFQTPETVLPSIQSNSSGGLYFVREGTPEWEAWQSHLVKTKGKRSPMRDFGWWFPTEYPPHE